MAEIVKRHNTIEQEPSVRAKNFKEVNLGFEEKTAILEANRCLECKNPRCIEGCPVGVKIPQFIRAIKEGNFISSSEIIKKDNTLPAVCGRVCPQEEQCEKLCIRQKSGGAVAIGKLEKFVADYALKNKKDSDFKPLPNGLKVAVIGSGPAGLTCAGDCAKAGFEVTVFEAFHKAGGVLVYGIPEFRLPKSIVEDEINGLVKLGVTIELNTVVGKTISLEELKNEYDYIFIGTGAGLPMFMGIKGENLAGVYSANEYLTRVNLMKAYKADSSTPIKLGKNIVVVGAGNVAMDSARTALRMGAQKVTIVYRRSRVEMPAREEEIIHAEEEGINFMLLTNPVEILGDKAVCGIKLKQMKLGEPDDRGRARPIPVEGSEYDIECDQVIIALGTTANPLISRSCKLLSVTAKGTIIADEDGLTSIDNVYAGGDAVIGAATVILAMSAGKRAARAIIKSANV